MALRHLSNPREGEDQGHGRELRALRLRVRELEAQLAARQQFETKRFDDAMQRVQASVNLLDEQAGQLISSRRALAEYQGKLSAQPAQNARERLGRKSSPKTPHKRSARMLRRIASWLRRLWRGGR